jgi:hypothetical protein
MRPGFGFLLACGTILSNALYTYSFDFISDVCSLHYTTFSFLGLMSLWFPSQLMDLVFNFGIRPRGKHYVFPFSGRFLSNAPDPLPCIKYLPRITLV